MTKARRKEARRGDRDVHVDEDGRRYILVYYPLQPITDWDRDVDWSDDWNLYAYGQPYRHSKQRNYLDADETACGYCAPEHGICFECSGTGKHPTFWDEQARCFLCQGDGACPICLGTGTLTEGSDRKLRNEP